MPIAVQCSGCSAKFNAPDKLAGQQANCPKCGNLLLIGLERIRETTASATSLEPARKAPAPSEKSPVPPKSKPAASSKPAESAKQKPEKPVVAAAPAKPPMIGPGMRRVLIILAVVAAILVLLGQVVAPLIYYFRHGSKQEQPASSFGYFKNADPNDPAVQAQLEALLATDEKSKPKPAAPQSAKKTTSSKPSPEPQAVASEPPPARPKKPWQPLEPDPHRLDPIGGRAYYPIYKLPDQYKHARLQEIKVGLDYREPPRRSQSLERHWNGEEIGMHLAGLLARDRREEPRRGWPYLLTTQQRNPNQRNSEPSTQLLEQPWHAKAGVVLARVVMPEDDPALRPHLRSDKWPRYIERLYCFLDGHLGFIRYVTPPTAERAGTYPDMSELYQHESEVPAVYAELFHVPLENIRRWGGAGFYEVIHVRGVYAGDQEMILHRHTILCDALERRRLAAE